MTKLKGAIVGFGKMGLLHFGILNTHPEVEISCICDTQHNLLSYIKRENKAINIYTDYIEMFEKEKLDFVAISTPIGTHFEIMRQALNKNINVFVEKPFTVNSAEGMDIISLLGNCNEGIVCQTGYVNRYQEIFSRVKNLLDNEVIGEIFSFSIEMYSGMVKSQKELKNSWRSSKKLAGGGCLIEFSSHALDLINWYFGIPDNILSASLKKVYSEEVEDMCHATFGYKSGMFGTITSTWCDPTYRLPLTRIQCLGANGKIIAQEHEIKIYLQNDKDGLNKGWNSIFLPDVAETVRFDLAGGLFSMQMDDFISSIINRTANTTNSPRSAYNTTKLIDEIYTKAGDIL
jgi:predicted dehydrogenase